MSGRQAKIAWGVLLGTLACLCVAWSVGTAQQTNRPAVESLLPADSIVYVGWDGDAAHKTAWEQTAAYESLYKTGAVDVIKKLVAFFVQKSGGDVGPLMQQVYEQLAGKGFSLAVNVVGEAGPPLPQATIVLPDAAALELGLSQFFAKHHGNDVQITNRNAEGRKITFFIIPDSPGVEIGWWTEGPHIVITVGIKAVDNALAVATGKSPNLSTSALWKKYRGTKPDFDVSFTGWFDIGGLRKVYGNMPLPVPSQNQPLTINRIAEGLGLDTLGAIVSRSGYKGKSLWSETTVEAPTPRKGLLALGEQSPLTLADLPPFPADCNGFLAASFDWSKFYNNLIETARSAAKLGPPEVPVQLEFVLQQIPQMIGFDPKADPLGNVLCAYDDAKHGVFGIGFGIAVKVDDAAKLRATIDNLLKRLPPAKEFSIVRAKKYDRELISLQLNEVPFAVSPTLTIDNNWLVLGLQPQSVDAFLLRLDKKLPKWEPTPAHQDALAQLPKQFTSLTVSDPRKTLPNLLAMAPLGFTALNAGLQQAGMLPKGETLPITAADLPPAELLVGPLFPNVSMSFADERGFHSVSRMSLPTIPIPGFSGGGASVGTTAVLVALILPAVQQAREAARRTQSKNNLKQIGLGIHNYADTHSKLPSGTHPNDALAPDKRLSWQADILPYMEQAALHQKIDFKQAWNDKANEQLTRVQLPLYLNPSMPVTQAGGFPVTHYVGIAGVGKDAPLLTLPNKKAGIFGYNRTIGFRDITDGTSNTIMVAEAAKDLGSWAAGGPATIRALTAKPYINGPDGLGGNHVGGSQFLFADGSVRFISEKADPSILEALSTIQGGETINYDQLDR